MNGPIRRWEIWKPSAITLARTRGYYARRYIARLFEAAAKLKDFPAMGRHVPEAGARTDVRELIFENYRIIYLVEPQGVQILTVIHGSRDLQGQKQKPWDY